MGHCSIRRDVSHVVCIILSLVLLSIGSVSAATIIQLAWDPNSEPDLDGYYLRYGTTSQVYTDFIDVGNVTSYDVLDLPAGTTFYFIVTAYDFAENESLPSNEISVVPTTVAPLLGISGGGSPDPVDAGGTLTYTLDYANSGLSNATGVLVTDTVPANTTFVSATAGGVLSGSTVTWSIGSLAAGASGSVQMTVLVDSPLPNGTTITNSSYTVDSNETAPVNGAAISTTVISGPDLTVVKTGSPDPVAAGGVLTYTLDYANSGNGDATGVVLSDDVPINTTFVSATMGGALSGNTVTWAIGTLGAGTSGSVQMTVLVDSPLPDGSLITNNSYSIDSNETTPVSGAAISTSVTSMPVLSISNSDAPDPVDAGATLTYTLDYGNSGNADATGVALTDIIPANTTFVSATAGGTLSGSTVTWPVGVLAAGGSGSVQLTVQVDSPLANGTVITNGTYSIDSNETAPVSGAAVSTTVTSVPVLSVSKIDGPDPVAAGGSLTYTLNYDNSGNADATVVVLTDVVPANTTFVSATAGGTLSGNTVTWSIVSLPAGGSGSAQMVVSIDSPLPDGTIITNDFYGIASNETAPVSGTATSTTVTSAPILSITASDSPDPVDAGGLLTYTLNYGNSGNAGATAVLLTDIIPASTTFVSATSGGTLSGSTVTWPIGSLATGGSGSVQMTVSVDSPLADGTIITNDSYSIDSDETAPAGGAAVSTTVTSSPVLSVTMTDSPDPVDAGGTLIYTLSYDNSGNADATGVVLTDAVPAATTFVSATAGGTLSGGTVSWPVGALATGGSGTVQMTVQVDSPLPNGTIITNASYSIDSDETAPVSGSAVTTTVTSSPALSVNMTDSPDPVAAGGTLIYTLDYGNSGNADATAVVLTDFIPANTTFVSATSGGTLSGGIVTWSIGSLAASESGSAQMTVGVDSPLPNGTIITNGSYSIDSSETAPVNGVAESTTITSGAVLSVVMVDSPDPVTAGGLLTYTLSYANAGNADATGVVLSDAVPVDTTFVSATSGGALSGSTVTWSLGSLAAGGSGSIQMAVSVDTPLPNGTIITNSSFSIDSNETAPVGGPSVSTTVTSAPVLSVSKTDGPDPVDAGGTLTYTIDYGNTGNADATAVLLTDVVPANTTFVSATAGGVLSGSTVTWSLGSLTVGGAGSVQMAVLVDSPLSNGTIITNDTYSIDSNETAPANGAAVMTTVTSSPALSVTMTDSPDPVAAGGTLIYTLGFDNSGNADATGVILTNVVPADTTFVSATAGGALSGNIVTWSVGSLIAGVSGSVQMTVSVDSPLPDGTIITNDAYSIDSNETAPVSGAAIATTVTSAPILSINVSDSPDPVAAGGTLTYSLSYSNSGTADASVVVISDTVPADTTFASATAGGIESAGVVTWSIGNVAAGSSGTVEMTVQVNSPLANGTVLTNGNYSIESNETAPAGGAAVSTTVTSGPVLSVTMTDSPDPVDAGSTLIYTLDYENIGNANATNVVLTDKIPTDTSFISATGGGNRTGINVTWSVGGLVAGGSGSVQMTVSVDNPLPNGTIITNGTYSIDSDETTSVSGAAVTTTVSSGAVLSIVKTASPDPVAAGGTLTYTLDFGNSGNAAATGVILTDVIPDNTTFVSATAGGALSGNTVTWPIGSLAAGGSGSIQMTVSVDTPLPTGTIIINDTYSIDSNETAPVSGAVVSTTVTSSPALSVAMTDSPDPVAAGGTLIYTLDYGNSGNADATAVVLTDIIPANTTFVSATSGGTLSGSTVTWSVGSLIAGDSGSVQMTVSVETPLPNGTIITNSSYSIDSNETAPVNGVGESTTITSGAVLSVVMTDSPDPVDAGGTLIYTLSYANAGNADATGVVLSDAVPLDTTFVSATSGGTLSGSTVTWSIGALATGGSDTVQLTVQVDSPLSNGTIITNGSYSIDSNETGPVSGTAVTTTVTSVPALSVSKTDGPDPVAAGGTVTYTLDYGNTGNANATAVLLTDVVPVNTSFVSATAGGTLSGSTVTWPIGSLAASGSGSVQMTVRVDTPLPNGTIITNDTYSIDSNETAPVSGPGVSTTVSSAPALSVAMTDSPDPVAAGGTLIYTLDYGNSGNADATAVVLTDIIPANTTFVSATSGGTLSGNTVTWSVGGLIAGDSGSVQLTVLIDSPLPNGTVITNGSYSIDSNETAPVNGVAESTTITSGAVLSVAMADSPDPVDAGGLLTYTLSYTNAGNADATGVVLTDAVPVDTTFVSATAGGTLSGGTVTWPIGILAAGGSGSAQMTVSVDTPLPNGTVITNGSYGVDSNETAPVNGAAITTTVISTPALSVTKTDGPDPVAAGGTLTYTLDYGNSGNADATGVVLTDVVPVNTTFVSATAGGALSGNTVTWSIGSLTVGDSGSVQFTVRVDSPLPDGTTITNSTYSIGSSGTAPANGVAITTTVTSDPVLSVAKTDGPDPIAAGGTLIYTLSFDNSGNADATNVVLTDTLPANTTFISATAGGFLSGNTVTWLIGSLAAGDAGSVQLSVLVDNPLANGTIITNVTYNIDSNETTPVSGAATTTTVTSDPVLSISKTAGPDPIAAGDTLVYTLSYTNSGNADATGVVLTDVVPANTTFVSATAGGTLSGGTVSWPVGTLTAAGAGSVQMIVRVDTPLADGTIITNSTYSIDSNETAPINGTAVSTTVTSSPALSITKIDGPDPVAAGGTLTYTLSYANFGNSDATGVIVTDTVPANTSFVTATAGGSLSGNTVSWSVGSLATGGSGSVQMLVRVATPLANNTTITNAAYTIDSNETTVSSGVAVATTVSSAPVIQILKQHSPDPVPMGTNLTYTMSFSNGGNANATGVVVTDTLPANTTFVSASPGGSLSGSTVIWPIGNLIAGDSGSVQLIVRVDSPLANGTVITGDAYAITSNETGPVTGPVDVVQVVTAPAPTVTSVLELETSSVYVVRGGTHTVQVSGSGFQIGAALNLSADISTDPTQILDPTQLEAVIRVGANATLGPRTLTVTNPDLASDSRDNALFVTRTPDISSDCMVDGWDLNAIARAWNSASGDPNYVAAADLDGDGLVGPDDLVVFAAYFASTLSACP